MLIMTMVSEGCGPSLIARSTGKNRSTICRELKNRRQPVGCGGARPCPKLETPPFVCNGCGEFEKCRLERFVYVASAAHQDYRIKLVDSRNGANISENELSSLNAVISDGVRKGQSLHHLIASNRDAIPVSEKTMYRYVNGNLVSVRRHDLPQAPYRRPRAKLKPRRTRGKARECLKGRTYDDWKAFIGSHPGVETVEIDSVIGRVGGKCLLTMNINCCGLMLAFLRDRNDAMSVRGVFNNLFEKLGEKMFREIFPVLLADNGSEFSNPGGIEFAEGSRERRTRVFYCNPYSSYEKPHVENNHENIRKILPKGTSFDGLTQEDVDLVMSHVNSMRRKEYKDRTAIERFIERFGEKAFARLGLKPIAAKDVCLLPRLLKRS